MRAQRSDTHLNPLQFSLSKWWSHSELGLLHEPLMQMLHALHPDWLHVLLAVVIAALCMPNIKGDTCEGAQHLHLSNGQLVDTSCNVFANGAAMLPLPGVWCMSCQGHCKTASSMRNTPLPQSLAGLPCMQGLHLLPMQQPARPLSTDARL